MAQHQGLKVRTYPTRAPSLTRAHLFFTPITLSQWARVLELFFGTGSVGKVCRAKGWDVESLDIDPRADINMDILWWDYKEHANVGDYGIIWGSPPCTLYSFYQNQHDPHNLRDLSPADELVLKTMEIISYFNPKYWFIENPQSGCLKHQDFMTGLPFHDVDYCMYGYGARKRTRIWTNYEQFKGKMCDLPPGVVSRGA